MLSPAELSAVAASTRSAHYTSPEIVKAMWTALRRLGFGGGRVLEPSVGAGNFFGLMPAKEFAMTVGGETFDKRKDAGERIVATAVEMEKSGARRTQIGSYGDFRLTLDRSEHGNTFMVSVKGDGEYHTTTFTSVADPQGVAQRIVNTINDTRNVAEVKADDVSVMGATLAELAYHIRANGGEVVGSVLLVDASRSGSLVSRAARLRAVEMRFGDAVRQELGVEPSALTDPEADYLLNFRGADALRDRIAAAKSQRSERLRAKGVRSDGQGRVAPRFSVAPVSFEGQITRLAVSIQ